MQLQFENNVDGKMKLTLVDGIKSTYFKIGLNLPI